MAISNLFKEQHKKPAQSGDDGAQTAGKNRFNVADFASKMNANGGFLKPAFFLVEITAPKGMSKGVGRISDRLLFLCHGGATPGRAIVTSPEKPFGQGYTMKMPYDSEVTDLNLRFYVDGKGDAIEFFENWMRLISPLPTGMGKAEFGGFSGEIGYRTEYTTTIKISMWNPASPGESMITYTLEGAYPIGLNEMNLDWSANGEVMVLSIPFTYNAYSVEFGHFVGNEKPKKAGKKPKDKGFDQLNALAESLRAGAANITSKINTAEEKAKSALLGNAFIGGALNLLDAAHSARDAIDKLRGLDDALRGGIQAGIPRFPKFGF